MIAIGCSEVVAPAASLGDDKNSNWVDVVLVVTAGAEAAVAVTSEAATEVVVEMEDAAVRFAEELHLAHEPNTARAPAAAEEVRLGVVAEHAGPGATSTSATVAGLSLT